MATATILNKTTRKSYQLSAEITALSSISHIGDSFGNSAKLRREKVVQPNGSVEQVPMISGNAIRGMLRDMGMKYMLELLGEPPLSMPAFYFLFSGGSLTKQAGKAIDIDRARRIAELIPLVTIFGGAVGNQIMPGRLQMGKMVPICAETRHIVPSAYQENLSVNSIWEYLQEESYTRRDDEKNPHLRGLIESEQRTLLDAAKIEKTALDKNDDIDREAGQHQQMIYSTETFAAGTRFWWKLTLMDVSQIEYEAFLSCLMEFAKNPVIGGKGAIGLGRVAIKFDHWHSIDPNIVAGEQLSWPVGKEYHSHLKDRSADILQVLQDFQ